MDYREKVEKSWNDFKKARGIGEAVSGADLMDFKTPSPGQGDRWGIWQFDAKSFVLFSRKPYRYEIDLEKCTTSAEVLDWIFQLATKTWMDAKQLGHLVYALEDILDPQANLCSFGQNKTFDVRKYLRERYQDSTRTRRKNESDK